jgi:hypothetical protein
MKPLLIALYFFSFSLFLLSPTAHACSSGGCGGCNLQNIRKDPTWMSFYQKVKAAGAKPISCYRSRQCQRNLVRTCGGGRAARGISNHEKAIAMDFSTKRGHHHIARNIASQTLTGNVRQLMHGGGGFHMSNGASEGSRLAVRGSRVVDAYRAQRQAAGKGSGGSLSGYFEIPGKGGKYIKRRNGEIVRMTWEPVR